MTGLSNSARASLPLSELRDQRVDLEDLRRRDARRLPGTLDPDTAVIRALELAATLIADGDPDPAATRAAVLLADPRARAEDVAAEIGLSVRQLRRRCHTVVGYGPKTLQRVLRFRRFVSRLDAGLPNGQDVHDLATLAAQAGYADQAHLTRECRALAGLTPAALARQRGPAAAGDYPAGQTCWNGCVPAASAHCCGVSDPAAMPQAPCRRSAGKATSHTRAVPSPPAVASVPPEPNAAA
jgi:AraC-like DNA-binding protein